MKGHGTVAATPVSTGKQWRWKWLALTVLLLVFFSMLVPLAFLLGLYNGFPVGHSSHDSLPSDLFEIYGRASIVAEQNSSNKNDYRSEKMLGNFTPLPLKIAQGITEGSDGKPSSFDLIFDGKQSPSRPMGVGVHSDSNIVTTVQKGLSKLPIDASNVHLTSDSSFGDTMVTNISKSSSFYGAEISCQLEFGSYCLWSKEHKEAMNDATIKRLKDQLFVARAYYPSIAKLQGQENLSREMKQNIQEHERMLSEAISDADLPPFFADKIVKMDQTIAKAKGCPVECSNVERKLRQILDLSEDETHFHMKQSAFLYGLGVQTMPKSLHCLSMRLTVEYFRDPSPPLDMMVSSLADKIYNPSFQHFVIFTRDILAASVTINSTVMCSKDTSNMVFHLLTDRENFYAMKLWFARNSYKEAVIHVLNIEDPSLSNSLGLKKLYISEEFRISVRGLDHQAHPFHLGTQYVSIFGHSHFLLAELFQNLKRVIVLDDDVIVQQELSSLWKLDLEGKINGAVSFCKLKYGQLQTVFDSKVHSRNSCLWSSGLNIIDLEKWREHDITGTYQILLQRFGNESEETWRTAALPASLLAFEDHTFPLDSALVISGLGHDYGVSEALIKAATALHYNGNMKPWLDLGIPMYKKYWNKFLLQGDQFMDECNVRH